MQKIGEIKIGRGFTGRDYAWAKIFRPNYVHGQETDMPRSEAIEIVLELARMHESGAVLDEWLVDHEEACGVVRRVLDDVISQEENE